MKSAAILALLAPCEAVKFDFFKERNEVRPFDYHWNEDYHSVPDPISGVNWMTATQAKYLKNEQVDVSSEPMGINYDFFTAYNAKSAEPVQSKFYLQLDDSEEFSRPADEVTVLWHVSPDYGELDDYVVNREKDSANGEKKSGWSNPLGWTDDGDSDDLVLQQISSVMRYEESEGPTKTDNGENDDWVTRREQDTKNGEKESGWTNPLGWSDEGDDDDTVL